MGLYRTHFYNGLTRKYISVFGSLFNNISVVRYDQNGVEASRERCPISFAPKDKFIQKLFQDGDLDNRGPAIKLPVMSFDLDSMEFDGARKYTSQRKVSFSTEDGKHFAFAPVPYKLSFSLNVYTRGLDEMYQVVEQILPFFQTDYTVTINPIQGSDFELDIPFNLMSVIPGDEYEGAFGENRAIIWSFSFLASVDYFGPIRNGKVIYKTTADINDLDTRDPYYDVEHTPIQNGETDPELINLDEVWSVITQHVYP